MSLPLIFLCLTRHAGSTLADLARDVAAAARPGDHVLMLDDSGAPPGGGDTARRIGRFLAEEGWPQGVTGATLITGTPGDGDLGVAFNLALAQLAIPGAAPSPARVLMLAGGTRLEAAPLNAARALADQGGHDLVLLPWREWSLDHARPLPGIEAADWPARPGESARDRARRLLPPMQSLLFDRALLSGLRAEEGRQGQGLLPLVWDLLARAQHPGFAKTALGHRPQAPDLAPDLPQVIDALLARAPEAAGPLAGWLAREARRLAPGPRAALLSAVQNASPAARLGAGRQGAAQSVQGVTLPGQITPETVQLMTVFRAENRLETAPLTGRARLRFHAAGRHARLMPVSWPALRDLWQDVAEQVSDPRQADLVLWAHPQDPKEDQGLATLQPVPQALLSEEPFWDTIFGPDPLARRITVAGPRGAQVGLHQVNHHRSPIYAFDRIPYFLLTRPEYAARYARLFARNAALSAEDWQQAFTARPRDLVFMAERRPEPYHDVAWPAGDILGLCAWRTRLAEAMADTAMPGERIGLSWKNGGSRFTLTDWHADKLVQLDGQLRWLSALENTHQPTYLSEKFFDALAIGARPIAMASPGHRLQDMGVPAQAFLNLWGMDEAEAVQAILTAPWDAAFFAAYVEAQQAMARLWTDASLITAERSRLSRALGTELQRLADLPGL